MKKVVSKNTKVFTLKKQLLLFIRHILIKSGFLKVTYMLIFQIKKKLLMIQLFYTMKLKH